MHKKNLWHTMAGGRGSDGQLSKHRSLPGIKFDERGETGLACSLRYTTLDQHRHRFIRVGLESLHIVVVVMAMTHQDAIQTREILGRIGQRLTAQVDRTHRVPGDSE